MAKFTILLLCLSQSVTVYSQNLFEWTHHEIQLLTGGNFELGTSHRSTITFEHSAGWRYGENFLFVDVYQRDDIGSEAYGEWYPRLSFKKLFDRDFKAGPIADFSIVGGLNAGTEPSDDPFKAYFLGVGASLDIFGAEFFKVDVMARKSDNLNTTGIQVTPAWSIPFRVGGLKFKFRGFLDWVSADGSGGESWVLTQPQIVVDVGDLFDYPDQLYAGIEFWYWHNKFGIDGLHEEVVQGMLVYSFRAQ